MKKLVTVIIGLLLLSGCGANAGIAGSGNVYTVERVHAGDKTVYCVMSDHGIDCDWEHPLVR